MANNLYYGRGNDEENERLIAFLNEVFFTDDPEGRDFLSLLPKCYKDKYRPAYNNFVVKDESGNFRSAIGSFYNDMTVGDEQIKACCIGNVAVGKDYRSMGYMIELMELSVEDMRKTVLTSLISAVSDSVTAISDLSLRELPTASISAEVPTDIHLKPCPADLRLKSLILKIPKVLRISKRFTRSFR